MLGLVYSHMLSEGNAIKTALDWLPDWSNQSCVIIGGGPSAIIFGTAGLRFRARTVVINRAYELMPSADMLYACDAKFWKAHPRALAFQGLKVCAESVSYDTVKRVSIVRERGQFSRGMHFDNPGEIGGGYNSGFQALNLVAQTGCRRIMLIGFDATTERGEHWHGRHDPPLTNPTPALCKHWREALDAQAPVLAARGIAVVNGSALSALTQFPKVSAAQWLHALP